MRIYQHLPAMSAIAGVGAAQVPPRMQAAGGSGIEDGRAANDRRCATQSAGSGVDLNADH